MQKGRARTWLVLQQKKRSRQQRPTRRAPGRQFGECA